MKVPGAGATSLACICLPRILACQTACRLWLNACRTVRRVPAGFWNQFYSLAFQGLSTDAYAPDLAHTLLELMEKAEGKPATGPPKAPNRIICCGHSLGGALASLGALWAAEVWPLTPVSVFTFGQPRVGNDKFVEVLQGVTSTGVR